MVVEVVGISAMAKRGRMFVGLMFAASAATFGTPIAETIGDHTTCITVSAIMGPPPLSKREVQAVANYIESALWLIDQTHAANGVPAILSRMSDHGRSHIVFAVAQRRREHPEETLLASTNAVYDGLKYAAWVACGQNGGSNRSRLALGSKRSSLQLLRSW